MSSKHFTPQEWAKINSVLDQSSEKFGFPLRKYGTVLLGSFNIRKLGNAKRRSANTWKFLAKICGQFDLLAVQEIMADMSGIKKFMEYIGPEFALLISDKTGVFPGDPGLGERLGYIYRWSVIHRTELATDVSYDRSKILKMLLENYDDFDKAFREKLKSKKKNLKLPHFLTFIREPYLAGFKIVGFPNTKPYELMVVNAHLFFGKYMSDRRQEFEALINWIKARIREKDKIYFKNLTLMGDLNLDFNDPKIDRSRIEQSLKDLNKMKDVKKEKVRVYFPFLDIHPGQDQVFRTNVRQSETFDQIGIFSRDSRLPHYTEKEDGKGIPPDIDENGTDYGVFNFVELFCSALINKSYDELSLDAVKKTEFLKKFEHNVSDHMPLWLRIKMPY